MSKIAVLEWKCFDLPETCECLKKLGHTVELFYHADYQELKSEKFTEDFEEFFERTKPDAFFSYNYFPVLAEECHKANIKYISFLYDSPYVYIYSYTLAYPTNTVFLFDSSWVRELNDGGLNNVYYMNLPCVADKLKTLHSPYKSTRTTCDVSFVGSLYNEQHNLYDRMNEQLTPYLKGYLTGVIESQLKVSGYSMLDELLTPDILRQLKETFPVESDPYSVEPPTYRYANYFLARKATSIERIRLLTVIGEALGAKYDIRLFTHDGTVAMQGIRNMGVAEYFNEMPHVFNESRININITLRSIKCGIPLRCMDILGCGGFLLSNYQSDFLIDFVPNEDFVYYEDADDLCAKIEYYLSHEKERADIAAAGAKKARKFFSLEEVFKRILDISGIK